MLGQFDVSHQSDAVKAMAAEWPMLEALVGGTKAVRDAGKLFLPQFPKETGDSYNSRLKTATLFPAFARTCGVMAAKPLARPIGIEGLPTEFEPWLEDIDRAGTDIHGFSSQILFDCLQKGVTGVLVDYPRADGVKTKAQEKQAAVRPYLTRYPAETILGWRTEVGESNAVLTQLRLLETVEEPDSEWATVAVRQIRVLTPGGWQVWRKNTKTDEWLLYEEGTTTLTKVPFVFFYGIKKGFGLGASPLLDLAYLNVEHYQSASDQQTILHVARVPILFARGFSETDNLTIGANSAATSMSETAELKFVEHSGAAIDAGRQSLLDLEDRMRQSGAELLVQKPAVTTATQIVSEGDANRSTLQRIAEAFEDSLETCLNLMGEWVGQTIETEVGVYKDFGASNLSDASAAILVNAEANGIVSKETVFTQLQRMDIVPQEVEFEDETTKVQAAMDQDIQHQAKTAKALADAAPKQPPKK